MLLMLLVLLVAGGRMVLALGITRGVDGGHGRERPSPRFVDRIGRHRPARPEMGRFSARTAVTTAEGWPWRRSRLSV
jgi:hypothetical protein